MAKVKTPTNSQEIKEYGEKVIDDTSLTGQPGIVSSQAQLHLSMRLNDTSNLPSNDYFKNNEYGLADGIIFD